MKKILLGLVAIGFAACTSPLAENGPRLCPNEKFTFTASDLEIKKITPVGENFDETSINAGAEVDFDQYEGVHFFADFGEEDTVEWELTIASKTSSNKKVYTNKSNKIDVYWYGNSESFPFFEDEDCDITVRIPCREIVKSNIKVKGKANFKKVTPKFGILIRDFDGNGLYPVVDGNVNDVNNGWFDGNVTFTYETEDGSPMGQRYLRMKRELSSAGWYLGGHSFPVNTADKKFENLFPTSDPNEIYLNFFLRADKYPNANTEIGIRNPSLGSHLATGNVNWTGWKLNSRKFSEMVITSGAQAGKTIPEADVYKLNDMILQLGASPEQTKILEYDYDFIFISFGAPLAN